MTKNPLINALAAAVYIVAIVLAIQYGTSAVPKPAGIIIPIAMLSLFTLSAAMMGYIFLSQPIQFYLDGKKEEGTTLFIKTVVTFAVLTALIFLTVLLSSII